MSLFKPDLLKPRITEISPTDLYAKGFRGLLLDIDNTLTFHDNQSVSPEVLAWLEAAKQAGLRCTIVSNAKKKRAEPFAHKIGLPVISMGAKPLPFGFLRAARSLGLRRKQCAAIGDQIFTDVMGAKLAGIYCIQVLPMELEFHKPFLLFKRRIENKIMNHPYDFKR